MLFTSIVLGLALAIRTNAQNGLVDCVGFNGLVYPNNTVCPGSNACCGPEAICMSNRLCLNPGDPPSRLVRGPCFNDVYDSGTCAQLCLFDEVRGFFPRLTVCEDGSLCCDDEDAQCCNNGNGRFVNTDGVLANSAPSTTFEFGPERTNSDYDTETIVSPAPTSTSQSSTTQLPVDTAIPTSDADANGGNGDDGGEDDNDNSMVLGLAIGIPVGVIALAAVVAFFWWRRHQKAKAVMQKDHEMDSSEMAPNYHQDVAAHMQKYSGLPAGELDTPPPRGELPVGLQSPRVWTDSSPTGQQTVNELPGNQRTFNELPA